MKILKFDVFGRDVLIVHTGAGWKAFYPGNEGKRRPARDIVLPPKLEESKILQYLDDLLHEWATDRNNSVKRVDNPGHIQKP
ncbi:MAG: hypothetical protein GY815_06850 [Gammaproteobacteria bacterium]|nr:hypothetical protein [Gammaproteobacteria bacterium]